MNGRIAKMLRRDAFTTATETYGKSESIKLQKGSQEYWEEHSPKAIYRDLKKAYYNGELNKENKK